jgi:hypothetical protein
MLAAQEEARQEKLLAENEGTLRVVVHKATGMQNVQSFMDQDPFVLVSMLKVLCIV